MVKKINKVEKASASGKSGEGSKAGKIKNEKETGAIMEQQGKPWRVIQVVYLVLIFCSAAFGYWLIISTLF